MSCAEYEAFEWATSETCATGSPLWSEGPEASVSYTSAPSWETVVLRAVPTDGGDACWVMLKVAVRYVRREVRSYSDLDRETFLSRDPRLKP